MQSGVENLNLTVTDFSSAPGSTFQLELETGITSGGQVNASGTVGLDPQNAVLDIDISSLSLDPLEAAIGDNSKVRLLSGALSLDGKLSHDGNETMAFTGTARVDELATQDTILNERFVAWKNLSIPSLEFALDKKKLAIDTLAFDAPYAKLTVKEDGTTNINDIFPDETASDDTAGTDERSSGTDAESDAATGSVAVADEDSGAVPFKIDVGKVTPRGHRVHEVKRDVDVLQRWRQRHWIKRIGGNEFDILPFSGFQHGTMPSRRAHLPPRVHEAWCQVGANVAAGTEHEGLD